MLIFMFHFLTSQGYFIKYTKQLLTYTRLDDKDQNNHLMNSSPVLNPPLGSVLVSKCFTLFSS